MQLHVAIRFRLQLLIVAVTCLFFGLAVPADAQTSPVPVEGGGTTSPFHGYSVARENSEGSYTGVISSRPDAAINWSGQTSEGCSAWYSGRPVYQTQWVIISTSGGISWIELGTGHQCNGGVEYWFWGYGYQGTWNPINQEQINANGTSRTFAIIRDTTTRWVYQVDGATKGTLTWGVSGVRVEAGLESYRASLTVPAYSLQNLRYTRNNGAFTQWAGMDASSVSPTSTMCGRWQLTTQWRAGENTSC